MRTPGLLIRNQTLYSAELRAHGEYGVYFTTGCPESRNASGAPGSKAHRAGQNIFVQRSSFLTPGARAGPARQAFGMTEGVVRVESNSQSHFTLSFTLTFMLPYGVLTLWRTRSIVNESFSPVL